MLDSTTILLNPSDDAESHHCHGRTLYYAEPTTACCVSPNGEIITGVSLVPISDCGYDCADEMIENTGDAHIILESPPVIGQVYEPCVINIHRDWESGVIDDWDVIMRPTKLTKADTNLKPQYSHLLNNFTEQLNGS